jgi:hypothetical protein
MEQLPKCPVCGKKLARLACEPPRLLSGKADLATYRCDKGHIFLLNQDPHPSSVGL